MGQVSGYSVAGKSGTAEIATEEGYIQDETIATFIGFAPADDPQFVVLVKLDRPDPAISRWAAYTATPIFSRIAHRLFEHLNIPPDAVRLSDESQSIFCPSAGMCGEMQSTADSGPAAEPSNQ
jgi:cell division protein FtsI/penicillin-binding protein 2